MRAELSYQCRGEEKSGAGGSTDLKRKKKRSEISKKGVTCRTCGNTITAEDQSVEKNGSHTHTFFNPAGIVFELACFKSAPGCSTVGQASSEFTWFSGHMWRLALCTKCESHLGWSFSGPDSFFYGLIQSAINRG